MTDFPPPDPMPMPDPLEPPPSGPEEQPPI